MSPVLLHAHLKQTMTDLVSISGSNTSQALSVPKLRDDGSNWPDYEFKARFAMGARRLVPHLDGTASWPSPFVETSGVLVNRRGLIATEEEIEALQDKMGDFNAPESLAMSILLQTSPPRLQLKIRQSCTTSHQAWTLAKSFAMEKGTNHCINVKQQMSRMMLQDHPDPIANLNGV